MTTATPEHLRSAVKTALDATEDITDPQHRSVALGKVLDHLLAAQQPESRPRTGRGLPARSSREHREAVASRNGPRNWIGSLVSEGFFSKPKSLAEVTEAVRAQGHHVESKNVTDPLVKLVQAKVLRRESKPSSERERGVWLYSNY